MAGECVATTGMGGRAAAAFIVAAAVCGGVFGVTSLGSGASGLTCVMAVNVAWMAGCSMWDLRYNRLPDIATLPYCAWWAGLVLGDGQLTPLGMGACWFGWYLLLACAGQVGGGDVKFAFGCGIAATYLAPGGLAVAVVVASMTTVLMAGLLRRCVLAHGPAMAIGVLAAQLYGVLTLGGGVVEPLTGWWGSIPHA